MERDSEVNSSHYVPSRLTLWCSVCGAEAGKGCTPIGGLRFRSHDETATGTIPKEAPYVPSWESQPARRELRIPQRWTPSRSVQ